MRFAVLPLAAILLVASSALGPSRAEDAPKDISLSLTPSEVSYVFGLLVRQPYQEVAALIQKMQAEVQGQAAKQPAAPPAKNDKK